MNLLLLDATADSASHAALHRLAGALADAGHGIAIAGAAGSALLIDAPCAAFPIALGPRWTLRASRQIRELERRAAIDVILAFDSSSLAACLPLHLTGTPVLFLCAEPRSADGAIRSPWRLNHGCRGVIAGSQGIGNRLIARGVAARRIHVVDLTRPLAAAVAVARICTDSIG